MGFFKNAENVTETRRCVEASLSLSSTKRSLRELKGSHYEKLRERVQTGGLSLVRICLALAKKKKKKTRSLFFEKSMRDK